MLAVGLLMAFFANFALAADISVEQAFVRATPPGAANGAAYLQLRNHTGKDIVFVSASSRQIPRVEFHQHQQKHGTMHMMQVREISVPANGEFHFMPGQHHIMLMGLLSPLSEGDSIRLQLMRANGELLEIDLPVKPVGHPISGYSVHSSHGEHKQ